MIHSILIRLLGTPQSAYRWHRHIPELLLLGTIHATVWSGVREIDNIGETHCICFGSNGFLSYQFGLACRRQYRDICSPTAGGRDWFSKAIIRQSWPSICVFCLSKILELLCSQKLQTSFPQHANLKKTSLTSSGFVVWIKFDLTIVGGSPLFHIEQQSRKPDVCYLYNSKPHCFTCLFVTPAAITTNAHLGTPSGPG